MSNRMPWILRLPAGVRNNPAWIFIGSFFMISGFTLVTGVGGSPTVKAVLPPYFMNIWGALILLGGGGLIYATIKADILLERLLLRTLSISLVVYLVWIIGAAGIGRSIVSTALGLTLVVIFEIRVAVIKQLINTGV